MSKQRSPKRPNTPPLDSGRPPRAVSIEVQLDLDQVQTLVKVADFYPKNMGSFRFVVAATSGEAREKLRFMAQESKVLLAFSEAMEARMRSEGVEKASLTFTLRALVAFWGRLLASVRSPHSRRKLRADEVARREAVALLLQTAVAELEKSHKREVAEEIAGRRSSEQTWMREALDAGGVARTSA